MGHAHYSQLIGCVFTLIRFYEFPKTEIFGYEFLLSSCFVQVRSKCHFFVALPFFKYSEFNYEGLFKNAEKFYNLSFF